MLKQKPLYKSPDFKMDFNGGGGTLVASWVEGIIYDQLNNGNFNSLRSRKITSLATTTALEFGSWPISVRVSLTIVVSTGGTLILRHAQNTSSGEFTTVERGSSMKVTKV